MLRKLISLTFFALAVLCGVAYYGRYFKWRACFNDLGRCYDSETGSVYLEQAGLIYLSVGVVFLAVAAFSWFKTSKSN